MSGYVVKRARRGFGSKWQKRYWQLLGDGALIYFSGDHRLKVLGEIDIAHTCYEVRHGAENCEIKFPPAVKPSCCFSVAVLKRTYYFFTYTTWEAEKWVEALSSTSYIINRLRPRNLDYSPAVQVALKALNETTSNTAPTAASTSSSPPVPPSTQPPPYHHKAPAPPPPPLRPSTDSSGSDDEEETASESGGNDCMDGGNGPVAAPPDKHRNMHMSVPDLRFDTPNTSTTHNGSWIDGSPRIRSSTTAAYTGTPSPLTSTLTSIDQNVSHPGERRRRKKVSYSPQFSDIDTSISRSSTLTSTSGGGRIDRGRQAASRQRYMSQGNLLQQGNFLEEITETEDGNTSTLPSPAKLAKMRQKWKSAYDVQQWSPAFEKLEELQKQEDMIRKRINEMKKVDSFSYLDIPKPKSIITQQQQQNLSSPFNTSLSQSYPEEYMKQPPEVPASPFSQPTPPTLPPRIPQSKTENKTVNWQMYQQLPTAAAYTPKRAPKVSPKPPVSMRPRSVSVSASIPSTPSESNSKPPPPPPPPPPSDSPDNGATFSSKPPPVPVRDSSIQHHTQSVMDYSTTTDGGNIQQPHASTPGGAGDDPKPPPPLHYEETSSKCISRISLKRANSFANDSRPTTEMNVWIKKELDKVCNV